MKLISTTEELEALCAELAACPYITVDTEFLRESTFWPILCLIQTAGHNVEGMIDPLAEGIDLQPFYDLLVNPHVLKVMHGCRQDVEIFHHLAGVIPTPLFDTQIAAMVCGFGDAVGYETLIHKTTNGKSTKPVVLPIGAIARLVMHNLPMRSPTSPICAMLMNISRKRWRKMAVAHG